MHDFNKYWPYYAEQNASLVNLLERFEGWNDSIKHLIVFFQAYQLLYQGLTREHTKLIKNLDESEVALGGPNIAVFKPWKEYSVQMNDSTETSNDRISNLVLTRLVDLRAETKTKIASFRSKLIKLQKQVYNYRKETIVAIEAQEKEKDSRLSSKAAPSSHHINTDPWINERLLQKQLLKMIEMENLFQHEMSSLFNDMAVFDYKIAEEMKRLMEEFALIKKSQWTAMITTVSESSDAGASINSTSHFDSFAATNRLFDKELWARERKVEDFPFQSKIIKIVKIGLLSKPGPFGWGYEPVECVITETGFFHCFSLTKSKYKELLEKSKRKEIMQSFSAAGVADTPLEDDLCFNEIDSKPKFSLSLSLPRIQVQLVSGKPGMFCFEIVISERKTKSIFTNKLEDKISRFEFKCVNESEMIEWMAVLQKNVQTLIPKGPPEPLFKTPKQVEENVEALMNNQNVQLLDQYPDEEDIKRRSLQGAGKLESISLATLVGNNERKSMKSLTLPHGLSKEPLPELKTQSLSRKAVERPLNMES